MRTEELLSSLCTALQANCGDILDACQRCGVSLVFVRQWRKDDLKINEALTEAENLGTQGLVSAAIQRGVRGIDKDVYYKGEVVGQQREFSDGLLQTLLKAKVAEFAKDGEGAGTGITVNIANIMPRADNYQQWLEMKNTTIDKVALPAPPELIQVAEFLVLEPFGGIEL